MKRLNTLYILLLASALAFTVACDDSEEVTTDPAAGEIAGTDLTPGGSDPAGEAAGTDAGDMAGTETSAGTDTAGTDAGGEMAGTDTAGTDTPAGTEMPPERVGPGDTQALSCMGDYCPSARLSGLTLPQSPEDATAGGCRLASEKNGTAIGGLLMLAGGAIDTNEFVQPDEEGKIELVVLNHLVGWMGGATGNEAGSLTSNFYTGVQETETDFSIDPVALDNGEPIIFFNDTTITDGLYMTSPADFIVDLPIEELPLQLRLSQAEVSGFVSLDERGFNMSEGVLGGYLTRDAIIELIDGINTVCAGPDAPSLCDSVGSVLSGNAEADLGLLLTILGGFDSAVAPDGAVSACAGDSPDCNAVSVCILIEMSSATITGIAAE